MKINKNKFSRLTIKFIYIILLIFLFGVNSGKILIVSECKFYELNTTFLFWFVPLVLMCICGYFFSRFLILKVEIRAFFYLYVPALMMVALYYYTDKLKDDRIERSLRVITKAKIIKLSMGKMLNTVSFEYYLPFEKRTIQNMSIKTRNLKEDDTILIEYVKDCKYMSRFYKLFPTKEELEKFSNDRYYKDGRFLDEL